ncbi:MAG: hypothetical protein M1821_009261 [Bathelium mastoideum]|nr:MAG: hypothetical protein M1821_009261 [Bathelium mastoideum]
MRPSPAICESCRAALRQSLRRIVQRPGKRLFTHGNLAAPQNRLSATGTTVTLPAYRIPLNTAFSRHSLSKTSIQTGLSRHGQDTRLFSSSAHQSEAITNPRNDEDGNPMEVQITPRAANRLKQIMTNESNSNLCLRISVESGGCHGFQYLMSLTDTSSVSQEDDTVFEGAGGAKIVLDEPSLELLKGSKVDYTMELIGSQFKIVDNPHATSSCGCGTSFDIKA